MYSAEAEEIVGMDGEMGPSAPPFSALEGDMRVEFGEGEVMVPSAPPLFEEVEVEVEERGVRDERER